MLYPLVLQLCYTRSEVKRALKGLTDAEARERFMPMNCISWNIGHLAWHRREYARTDPYFMRIVGWLCQPGELEQTLLSLGWHARRDHGV